MVLCSKYSLQNGMLVPDYAINSNTIYKETIKVKLFKN